MDFVKPPIRAQVVNQMMVSIKIREGVGEE